MKGFFDDIWTGIKLSALLLLLVVVTVYGVITEAYKRLVSKQTPLDKSGQNCIYDHDHQAEPQKCVWHN